MAREDVESEVTGTGWKIETKVGDSVSEGDVLMIIESMKMEIPVLATEDGSMLPLSGSTWAKRRSAPR